MDMEESANPFVFPVGLNLLAKDTKLIVNKISRTREATDKQESSDERPAIPGPKRRVVFQGKQTTLVPNLKGRLQFEREQEDKKHKEAFFDLGKSRKFEYQKGNIVGHVRNYESNRQEQIRDDKIRDILQHDRKRRKKEKKVRADKSKDNERPTALIFRGLQEKTFKKHYIRRHLQKYGEIVRISSVVGHARAVMVRFSSPSVCKKVYKIGTKDVTELFPRFPKAEVKMVKSDIKEEPIPTVAAFQPVPRETAMIKPVVTFI